VLADSGLEALDPHDAAAGRTLGRVLTPLGGKYLVCGTALFEEFLTIILLDDVLLLQKSSTGGGNVLPDRRCKLFEITCGTLLLVYAEIISSLLKLSSSVPMSCK